MPNAMYLRKSRAEEQASTEEVLAKHREALVDLAVKKGIIVTDVFDEVVSGESLYARPQMLRLLEGVNAGRYEAVLCMDIDRLGRGGMADQGVILDAFRYSDTLIVTPDKTYNLSDEMDEELTEFKAFMARREYKMIRKRMRRGLMQTIEAGGYVANPPYGYQKTVVDKLPTLEIVDVEAVFVHMMYDHYQSGTGSYVIAQELNAAGSVPRRNAQWSASTVREILQNPTYAGFVAWNRVKHYKPGTHGNSKHHVVYMPRDEWKLAEGKHEAIIPRDQWETVQQIRKSRSNPPTTKRLSNPLAGLIYCSVCGGKMQQVRAGNTSELYLYCHNNQCCASAKLEYVEEHLIEALSDELERLRIQSRSFTPPDTEPLKAALEAVGRELSKLDARLPRLYEFLEDGTYDRDTFRQRLEAAENEKAALLERQSDIEKEIIRIGARDLNKTVEKLETALAVYPTLDIAEKNRLLKSIIERVDFTKPKKTKPDDFSLDIRLRYF
ncbi:MAG: recombinase family protein [Clostridia bacterium]|nr:recombinase family protein [Clostridia bacterium]